MPARTCAAQLSGFRSAEIGDRIGGLCRRAREKARGRRAGARSRHSAHRQFRRASSKSHHLVDMLDLAVAIGAHRVEIANVQYYGWALKNRAALMPTREQLDWMTARRRRGAGAAAAAHMVIDYVVPDYYARRPEILHGRLGPALPECFAIGQGSALPRRGDHHQSDLRQCAATQPCRIWRIPKRSTAFAAPIGCRSRAAPATARDRLGRLPLPGFRNHRRCRTHRSRLRSFRRS